MSSMESTARNVRLGWEAIDIFLFSNGQNSSPPRKYHLRMDEMDWWEAILNHLAKSHFGFSHTSIELYTLSGSKIEGPCDLSNGMACVAVVPPDKFTDAGYQKYLCRAARSFEKRKAKNATEQPDVKISDTIITLPLEVTEETGRNGPSFTKTEPLVYPDGVDGEAINRPEENIPKKSTSASTVVIVKSQKQMQKSDLSSSQVPRSVLPPSLNVRNEKRRSSLARTSFLKTLQSTNKSKQDSQIKKPKTSLKPNDTASMLTGYSKRNSLFMDPNETLEKSRLTSPPLSALRVSTSKALISDPLAQFPTMLTANSKGFVTDPLPLQDIMSDRDMVVVWKDSNLYQNRVSEIKAVKIDSISPFVDEITDCNVSEMGVDKEIQTKVEISSCAIDTASFECYSPSNSKIKVIPANINSQSNFMNCDIPLADNCIAVINKGNAVNLKLQIELQNTDTERSKESKTNWQNPRKTSSLSNLFKKRKSDLSDDPVVGPSKSLDSVIYRINECYTKVVVVQCSCCGNKTAVPREDTTPVYKDPNGFFILMPNTSNAQQDNYGCICCPNHQKLCSDNRPMPELCLEDLCKPKSSTVYPSVQEVGMVMTLKGSFGSSQTDEPQRNGVGAAVVAQQVLYNNMTSIKKDGCFVDVWRTSLDRTVERLEDSVSASRMLGAFPCERVDSYTQTEWCSIMLKTQRHEDGRYSFYFPSLQLLKHYSLL